MSTETCDACAFDASHYNRPDLLGTLRALVPMWREMTEGVDEAVLAQRPAPEVWSALEYASHSRDVVTILGLLLHMTVTEDHPVLPPGPGPDEIPAPRGPATMAEALTELDGAVAAMAREARDFSDEDWARRVTVGDATEDAEWIVGHAVHDAVHHLRDVGRGLRALGAGAPTQHGTVVQVSASDGGVPKTAIGSATIDARGVGGDHQHDRKHHGRPLQALCLWSREVIDELRAEGHSVQPGAAGENLTLAGIDWTTIRAGVRVRIGDVLAEISAFSTPCAKNAQWFADRDFSRIDHAVHPGSSRAYAWVLEGGRVATGDPVVVEP